MTFINTYLFQTASKSLVLNPGFHHAPCDGPICSHLNWIAVKLTILFVGNCTELIRTMTFSFHFNSFYCGLCFQENFASYNIRLQPTFRNCFISACIHDTIHSLRGIYKDNIFKPFWNLRDVHVYQLNCRTMLKKSNIHLLLMFCKALNYGRYLLIS